MKSASYLQSVLVEYKMVLVLPSMHSNFLQQCLLSHLFGKLLVMEEDRTNS